jgi:DUF4097 and DUF4098 domain-containing protein YvlB
MERYEEMHESFAQIGFFQYCHFQRWARNDWIIAPSPFPPTTETGILHSILVKENPHPEQSGMNGILKVTTILGLMALITIGGTTLVRAGGPNDVNKNLEVLDGVTQTRNLKTVNGSITVGKNAKIAGASVVNGTITIGDKSTAGNLRTVNGNVELGDSVTIDGQLKTVNGDVTAGKKATFKKGIETVTGAVELNDGTKVNAGVQTVTGSIQIGQDSVVKSGLRSVTGAINVTGPATIDRIENRKGDVNLENATILKDVRLRNPKEGKNNLVNAEQPDTVRIGPGTHIKGSVIAERPIKLLVHKDAKIDGGIKGATSEPYGE